MLPDDHNNILDRLTYYVNQIKVVLGDECCCDTRAYELRVQADFSVSYSEIAKLAYEVRGTDENEYVDLKTKAKRIRDAIRETAANIFKTIENTDMHYNDLPESYWSFVLRRFKNQQQENFIINLPATVDPFLFSKIVIGRSDTHLLPPLS